MKRDFRLSFIVWNSGKEEDRNYDEDGNSGESHYDEEGILANSTTMNLEPR